MPSLNVAPVTHISEAKLSKIDNAPTEAAKPELPPSTHKMDAATVPSGSTMRAQLFSVSPDSMRPLDRPTLPRRDEAHVRKDGSNLTNKDHAIKGIAEQAKNLPFVGERLSKFLLKFVG